MQQYFSLMICMAPFLWACVYVQCHCVCEIYVPVACGRSTIHDYHNINRCNEINIIFKTFLFCRIKVIIRKTTKVKFWIYKKGLRIFFSLFSFILFYYCYLFFQNNSWHCSKWHKSSWRYRLSDNNVAKFNTPQIIQYYRSSGTYFTAFTESIATNQVNVGEKF